MKIVNMKYKSKDASVLNGLRPNLYTVDELDLRITGFTPEDVKRAWNKGFPRDTSKMSDVERIEYELETITTK